MKLSSPVLSYWPEVEIVVLSKFYFSMCKENICGGRGGGMEGLFYSARQKLEAPDQKAS